MDLPIVPEGCVHNAHMFFVKVKDIKRRKEIMGRLKEMGVDVVFHYVPLHSSPGGLKFGRFYGEDRYTTKERTVDPASHVVWAYAGGRRGSR